MTLPVFITAGVITALAVIALAVGLGVGLSRRGDSDDDNNSNPDSSSPPTTNSTTNSTSGTFWTPNAGTTWQIVLLYALNDTSANASVYDIDLFTNPESTISNLHDMNRKVICYFSAGSYEEFRPDANEFNKTDYGKELDGWPGEYWLNTSSPNVRRIMQTRLDMAVQKGCDGVDPDNVDGFDNDNGIDLTQAGAAEYVNWLAGQAHGRGLALGLKNAGKLINDTLSAMQWQVNEQCDQYEECATFQPFIEANKPVFHIEYPTVGGKADVVSATKKADICGDSEAKGFSTVLKNMLLDDWVETC